MSYAESIVDDGHARPWSDAARRTEVGGHLTSCSSVLTSISWPLWHDPLALS